MKITIEPTERFFMAGDVMVRMWVGTTADGMHVTALVTCVAFEGDMSGATVGLVRIPPPTPEAAQQWAAEVMARARKP